MTDTLQPQESNGKGNVPSESQTNNPGIVDPMKTAVEEAVAAALGNVPGLKDFLSAQGPAGSSAQILPTQSPSTQTVEGVLGPPHKVGIQGHQGPFGLVPGWCC